MCLQVLVTSYVYLCKKEKEKKRKKIHFFIYPNKKIDKKY